jgi:son of sevenless-like protein
MLLVNHTHYNAQCGKGMGTANNINPRWFAPELLQQTGPVSTYSDVWSFGMLCLEVLSGQPPYAKFNRDVAVLREVDNGRPPDHPGRIATQNGLSDQMWKVMQMCWNLKPEARPSITEVKNALLGIRGHIGLPQGMQGLYKLCHMRYLTEL